MRAAGDITADAVSVARGTVVQILPSLCGFAFLSYLLRTNICGRAAVHGTRTCAKRSSGGLCIRSFSDGIHPLSSAYRCVGRQVWAAHCIDSLSADLCCDYSAHWIDARKSSRKRISLVSLVARVPICARVGTGSHLPRGDDGSGRLASSEQARVVQRADFHRINARRGICPAAGSAYYECARLARYVLLHGYVADTACNLLVVANQRTDTPIAREPCRSIRRACGI